jgi:hypothetical protein
MGREHHGGIIHVVTDALPPVQFHTAPPSRRRISGLPQQDQKRHYFPACRPGRSPAFSMGSFTEIVQCQAFIMGLRLSTPILSKREARSWTPKFFGPADDFRHFRHLIREAFQTTGE